MFGEVDRDIRVLSEFIKIYCDNRHKARNERFKQLIQFRNDRIDNPKLCSECKDLLEYSIKRRRLCPLNPKPMCRKCKIHCYSNEYRLRIKEVMRFSGTYLIRHGRLDLIFYYFF
jgi:hypothetical protein